MPDRRLYVERTRRKKRCRWGGWVGKVWKKMTMKGCMQYTGVVGLDNLMEIDIIRMYRLRSI